jgi:hypothetical protein
MKQPVPQKLITFVTLTIGLGVAYYFLIQDNFAHLSVSSIIDHANHLSLNKHVFVLGLVPIYIGLVIFGISTLGMYLASKLYHHINCRTKPHTSNKL